MPLNRHLSIAAVPLFQKILLFACKMFGQTIYGLKKWSYICRKFQTGIDSLSFLI